VVGVESQDAATAVQIGRITRRVYPPQVNVAGHVETILGLGGARQKHEAAKEAVEG
jgi:hypothetical protein